MNFIELTGPRGKFLLDFDSQWVIHDKGDEPAQWSNDDQGYSFKATETYAWIRSRLALTNPMLGSAQGEEVR